MLDKVLGKQASAMFMDEVKSINSVFFQTMDKLIKTKEKIMVAQTKNTDAINKLVTENETLANIQGDIDKQVEIFKQFLPKQ